MTCIYVNYSLTKHPSALPQYLCNGLEEDIAMRQAAKGASGGELELLMHASGKMVLLGKLLPKLRSEGHKVGAFRPPQ
jgi:hypothetical protein